ncbi:conserved hypothetical protein [Ricinus communis]|uniref:Uncharacterized protein n=1 Tax=Ricinus communis TaxID=3988 RepID=B9SEK2_RICCO|nr:conserved hypothetical protein [Ricinus communis]
MAMGMMSVTIPAVAAAAGIYFLDKNHSQAQKRMAEVVHGLGSGMRGPVGSMVAKVKEEVKSNSQMPKLAPQFDGLYSFETLVGR